jgi:hypothetical protein
MFARGAAVSRLAADRRHRENNLSLTRVSRTFANKNTFVTMALELFTKKFMETASGMYKRAVATELNKMGKLSEEKGEETKERLPLVGL